MIRKVKRPAKRGKIPLRVIESAVKKVTDDRKGTILSGDTITIQGMRMRKDGTFTRRCKAGNETVLIVGGEK